MTDRVASTTVLMADDDRDDCLMVEEALRGAPGVDHVRFVDDGADLLDYLSRRGRYGSEADSPRPGLILLDLNMPKIDGREALRAIKADERSRKIPVVVLTTSQAEEDIRVVYDLGAAGYITKPASFARLVEMLETLARYWFGTVELPDGL